jgi:hypothetical protein
LSHQPDETPDLGPLRRAGIEEDHARPGAAIWNPRVVAQKRQLVDCKAQVRLTHDSLRIAGPVDARDLGAAILEAVPRPVAIQLQHDRDDPVVLQFAFRGKRNDTVVA